jgi:hypothetical protein
MSRYIVLGHRCGQLVCASTIATRHDGVVAPKALTLSEMTDLAQSLQALLDAIERDEMTASTATTYRLEGAVAALRASVGEPVADTDGDTSATR